MPDPLAWLDAEAERRRAGGLVRTLVPRTALPDGRIVEGGRTLLNFASNDYLALANDPRVRVAASLVAGESWGAAASPLVCGWHPQHEALARDIAAFEGAESALIFPSGFAANAGAIAALVGPGDAVYADRLDHACLVAGARLAGARLRVFPHDDPDRLGAILARERPSFRRALIATDGVFSMDGDLAPLPALADLADRFDAMLLVDEAHGTGVHGESGRGAAEALGVADRVPIRVGTLSKALGSVGGFVAGSHRLIDHLRHAAPTFSFSTGLPPAAAAAARAALAIVRAEPGRRLGLLARAASLRDRLVGHGLAVPPGVGPIIPVVLGAPDRAVAAAEALHQRGYLVPAIRPPTVPRGTSRLRISLGAAHDAADLDALADALAAVLC
jgi:8-amino-7-oxononanoate synthase